MRICERCKRAYAVTLWLCHFCWREVNHEDCTEPEARP